MNLYRNNLTIGSIPQLDVVVPEFFPKTGLVSYYKLDGNSNDAHGSNNGTGSNITYSLANGKIDQGAGFNGSSSRINCGNDSSLKITGSITISAWVKTSNPSQGDKRIVDKGVHSSVDGFVLDLYNGCRLISYPTDVLQTNENLPSNTWVLITALYNKDTGVSQIYYNTTKKAEKTGLSGNLTLSSNSMIIGASPDASNKEYSGSIDEVGIWSRALTSDEITKLYNNGNGLTY